MSAEAFAPDPTGELAALSHSPSWFQWNGGEGREGLGEGGKRARVGKGEMGERGKLGE